MSAITGFTNLPNGTQTQEQYDAAWNTTFNELDTFATELNAAAIAMNLNDMNATSTTSMSIAIGVKSFTTQTGKSYLPGMAVNIGRTSDGAYYMRGVVKTYNNSTGAMSVLVTETNNTGTYNAWSISLAVPPKMSRGILVPILEMSPSGASQVDIEDSYDAYDDYYIDCDFTGSLGSIGVFFKVGGSYITGQSTVLAVPNTTVVSTSSGGLTIGQGAGSASLRNKIFITVFDAQNTTHAKMAKLGRYGLGSAGVRAYENRIGSTLSTQGQLQGVRLSIVSGGTFTGSVKLYGITK